MFLPYSYVDDTDHEWSIYDLELLLDTHSQIERDIVGAGLVGLPGRFEFGANAWEARVERDCVWIDRQRHDAVLAEIRNRLASDARYVRRTSERMRSDVAALEGALSGKTPKALFGATCRAASWMSANWLHSQAAVRMAIARFYDHFRLDADSLFAALLVGSHESLLRLAFSAAHRLNGAPVSEFDDEWGAAFENREEIVDGVARIRSVRPELNEHLAIAAANSRSTSLRLTAQLVSLVLARDGPGARDLLVNQIELLRTTIWQEERRRVLQDRAVKRLTAGRQELRSP